MNSGQADVFVATSVTGNKVAIEQFVVVGPARLSVSCIRIAICNQTCFRRSGVGDIIKERMSGTDGVRWQRTAVSLNQTACSDDLHFAVVA
ncbi:hypothetical protein D3C86_1870130 [compost metagenome]